MIELNRHSKAESNQINTNLLANEMYLNSNTRFHNYQSIESSSHLNKDNDLY